MTILAFSALLPLLLYLLIRKKKKNLRLSIFPVVLVSGFFAILYTFALLFQLNDDRGILKITLSGKTETKVVEWKTPTSPLQHAELTCYEVIITSMEDEPLYQAYVYGDLCAIRCKIIRLHPWLNWLGFSNLYHIDAIYNGYWTAEDYNRLPVEATSLLPLSPLRGIFERFFWNQWKKHFADYYASKWIKSATLESNYFPLHLEGPCCSSFLLTITPGGLSSIPLQETSVSL